MYDFRCTIWKVRAPAARGKRIRLCTICGCNGLEMGLLMLDLRTTPMANAFERNQAIGENYRTFILQFNALGQWFVPVITLIPIK